jgi:nucleoside-diphosphate-sugar epimerase
MKILVTGSRGYCGVAMVPALLDQGHSVIGLDVSPISAEHKDSAQHREVLGSFSDKVLLNELLQDCGGIVHAAIGRFRAWAQHTPGQPLNTSNMEALEITAGGTVQLLEVARQQKVRQIVLISSTAVVLEYVVDRENKAHEYMLTAQTPYRYWGIYSFSKMLQEQICEHYARTYDMSTIVLRPCWVVDGPSHSTKFGTSLSNPGESFVFAPTGFVDRYDLGLACHQALLRPDISYDIFYPVVGPRPERFFDVEHLNRELDWQPRYTFLDATEQQ